MTDEALRAYYLQQMGIELWKVRGRQAPHLTVISPEHADLVVILEMPLGYQWHMSKVAILLNRMLGSVGLLQEEIGIICAAPLKMKDDVQRRDLLIHEQICQLTPKLLLILGDFSTEVMKQVPSPLSIMSSVHPLELLKHGIKKKQAFQDVMNVKNKLQIITHNA